MATGSRAGEVRAFNRFYTRQVGALGTGLLGSPFSLSEVRVLYEIAHRDSPTAAELCEALALDAGYSSRMLAAFERKGLVRRARSRSDARRSMLSLTTKGRAAFEQLDARADEEIEALLAKLSSAAQRRLVAAMQTLQGLLEGCSATVSSSSPVVLRAPRAGDLGWVVQRHGALYAQEYGWSQDFEALVAEIVATFVKRFDAARERCWIAEKDGENAGVVFLVKKSQTVAQLRCLLVEPSARGLGVGEQLVAECSRFARAAGYRKIVLWTNDVLRTARRLYERAGYRLVREEKHTSFGKKLVGQTWELTLPSL